MMKRAARLLLATSSFALAGAALGNETVTYSYDALGRLTATTSAGTVNNGVATGIAYDPAGNRSTYTVSGAGTAPPPPPPPPPPANQPPVTANDTGSVARCEYIGVFSPLTNDYDPDGDSTQLEVVATSYTGSLGTAVPARTQLRFLPNNSGTGTAVITYTVADEGGATATGTFTLSVIQAGC